MADLTYQYGGATIAITDMYQRGGNNFSWAISGLAGVAPTTTTGTAATQLAAIAAAETQIANLGQALYTNPGAGQFPATLATLQTYASNSPDSALTTPLSSVDEEFNGTTYNPAALSSKWTVNSNGAGAVFTNPVLSWYNIKSSPLVAVNLCALTQAVPSQSFRITAKIRVNGIAATAPIGGMVLGDGTGKFVMIGTLTATNTVTYATYASATGAFTSVATTVTDARPLYWAIDYNKSSAGNVRYEWSFDGARWETTNAAFTTAVASFLGATCTVIGFGCQSGIVADGNLSVSCDWMHHVL